MTDAIQMWIRSAARVGFVSRRDSNGYLSGTKSLATGITKGATGEGMRRFTGIVDFSPEIPEPPRSPAVGDGGLLATFIGAITDPIGGSASAMVFDQTIQAMLDQRLIYSDNGMKVTAYNASNLVLNDVAFVIMADAVNQDPDLGVIGASGYHIVEFLNVEAVQGFAPFNGQSYDGVPVPYSLTLNNSNKDLFGTTMTSATRGSDVNLFLEYWSPYKVYYHIWQGNGSATAFTIPSDYVPAGNSQTYVTVAVNGVPLTYAAGAGNYTVSGQTITFGTAPADGAIIIARIRYV